MDSPLDTGNVIVIGTCHILNMLFNKVDNADLVTDNHHCCAVQSNSTQKSEVQPKTVQYLTTKLQLRLFYYVSCDVND